MRLPVSLDGADRPTAPHKGLLLNKFSDPVREGVTRKPALDALVKISSSYDAYKLAFERWKGVVDGLPGSLSIQGWVKGRMALGLGIESVHEIGCRLHHTYGVPVIPASSLKGVLRSSLAANPAHAETVAFLFGDTESAGFLKVLDGWWIPEGNASGLAVDVITVHHGSYYSGKGAPVDTESPIPVHFLSVTGRFFFGFDCPNDSWKPFVRDLVKSVLGNEGIGAKRSAGYGRFRF